MGFLKVPVPKILKCISDTGLTVPVSSLPYVFREVLERLKWRNLVGKWSPRVC
jgi:hypothetical protein